MAEEVIVVGEVKIADLRKRLRTILDLKGPRIVQRQNRPVAILLPVEVDWFGRVLNPRKEKARLLAAFEAAFAKLTR